MKDCGRPHLARGYCKLHYRRLMENGDPLVTKKAANGAFLSLLREAAQATTDQCIVSPGRSRRPVARINGRTMNASRAVWTIAHGDPGKLHVLHTCHNGQCLNIRHLYTGDHERNMLDMTEADRWGAARTRGEGHGRAVLTDRDVLDIRRRAEEGESTAALAREYGVHWRTVDKVIKRETWRHLDHVSRVEVTRKSLPATPVNT